MRSEIRKHGNGKKTFAWQPKSKLIQNLMASPPGVIIINWTFQGVLGMVGSELIFKILYEVVIFAISFTLLFTAIRNKISLILLCFFIAHTLNWTLNNSFFAMLRYVGYRITRYSYFQKCVERFESHVQGQNYLLYVLVYGSISRGEDFRPTSDYDVRIVPRKGIVNRIKANLLLMREKTIAFFTGFPLDAYLYDDVSYLSRLRKDEKPLAIVDNGDFSQSNYI